MSNINKLDFQRVVNVTAKASSGESATTGKIVVKAKKFHKVIPAVLFTPEKSDELLEIMEEAYTTANNVYKK